MVSDEELDALELPADPYDLLTDEERAALQKDLMEMACLRRRAEAEAANWVLP